MQMPMQVFTLKSFWIGITHKKWEQTTKSKTKCQKNKSKFFSYALKNKPKTISNFQNHEKSQEFEI